MNLSSSWEEVSMLATTRLLQFFFSFYVSGLVKCHPLQRTMLEVMGARRRQRRKSCQHESHHRQCDASRPTCALGQPWRHKLAAISLILQDIRDLLSAGCSKHSLRCHMLPGNGMAEFSRTTVDQKTSTFVSFITLLCPIFSPDGMPRHLCRAASTAGDPRHPQPPASVFLTFLSNRTCRTEFLIPNSLNREAVKPVISFSYLGIIPLTKLSKEHC